MKTKNPQFKMMLPLLILILALNSSACSGDGAKFDISGLFSENPAPSGNNPTPTGDDDDSDSDDSSDALTDSTNTTDDTTTGTDTIDPEVDPEADPEVCIPKIEIVYYPDADGDGYGSSTATTQPEATQAQTSQSVGFSFSAQTTNTVDVVGNYITTFTDCDSATTTQGYVTNNSDCDDSNAEVHPHATEIAGDGINQDCKANLEKSIVHTSAYKKTSFYNAQGLVEHTITIYPNSTSHMFYTYDEKGNLLSQGGNADGSQTFINAIEYSYDENNRLLSEEHYTTSSGVYYMHQSYTFSYVDESEPIVDEATNSTATLITSTEETKTLQSFSSSGTMTKSTTSTTCYEFEKNLTTGEVTKKTSPNCSGYFNIEQTYNANGDEIEMYKDTNQDSDYDTRTHSQYDANNHITRQDFYVLPDLSTSPYKTIYYYYDNNNNLLAYGTDTDGDGIAESEQFLYANFYAND